MQQDTHNHSNSDPDNVNKNQWNSSPSIRSNKTAKINFGKLIFQLPPQEKTNIKKIGKIGARITDLTPSVTVNNIYAYRKDCYQNVLYFI